MISSERSPPAYSTLPPKLPQQTCLTPARGSEAGTTPILFSKNEVNVFLKQVRQQPTTKLLQTHNLSKFITKMLSLFPDEFFFPLLEYNGASILFSKPATTAKRTRLAQNKNKQQTKLVLGFNKSCLTHGDEAFDALIETYSDTQFTPPKKVGSFDPNHKKTSRPSSAQQSQLENCAFIQLPQTNESNNSPIKLRTPPVTNIYRKKSPIAASKNSSSSSQRSSNTSNNNNNYQLPVPSLGVVTADISNGQEKYKIAVINEYNRIQPTKFEYQAHLPDMAPNQINTSAVCKNIRSKILEITKNKIKRINKTCGSSCKNDEIFSNPGSHSDENPNFSDNVCRNCACSKSVQNFPSYVRKPISSSQDSDSSDSSSSDCLVINPKLMSTEHTNEIFECGQNCCCNPLECENRIVQNTNGKMAKEVQIKMTQSMGFGLFSEYDIGKGQYIGPYTGKIVLYDESNWTELSDKGQTWDDSYFFETCLEDEENRVIVDSKHWGNASRFINHHCEPNVKVVHVICEKFTVPIIALFAAKNIKANDELYIDYTDSYWRADSSHEKFCSCGSKHCRYSDPELSGFKATVRKRKKKAEFSVKRGRSVADDKASRKDSSSIALKSVGDNQVFNQNRRNRIKHIKENMQISETDEIQITKDWGETNSSTSVEISKNEADRFSETNTRPVRSRGRGLERREINYDLLE